jgi:hypothetical protein
MGRVFDKHGRTNREEFIFAARSDVCRKCGAKVENMIDHNALFHPEYRTPKPEPKLIPIDPNDSRLEEYEGQP